MSENWFPKTLLEEHSAQYRTVWELYIKFYTVFLMVNFVALGLTLEHVNQEARWPIAVAFLVQNALTFVTGVCMAIYSARTADKYDRICKEIIDANPKIEYLRNVATSPTPAWLGRYGGYANAASQVALIICWVSILYVKTQGS